MNSANVVKLYLHNGRQLTRPEILLDQFHARKNEEMKRLADEKLLEKSMLARLSFKLIAVPSVRLSSSNPTIDLQGRYLFCPITPKIDHERPWRWLWRVES